MSRYRTNNRMYFVSRSDESPKQIYQLKISLRDIKPPIWRRILISSHAYFSELHKVIEKYFSWEGYHLHEFSFPHPFASHIRVYIKGTFDFEEEPSFITDYEYQSDEVRLCDILNEERRRAYYLYDFGDNWEHIIRLEKIFQDKASFSNPICVGGRRAAPPEDIGGVYGYYDFIESLGELDQKVNEEITIEYFGVEDLEKAIEIDMKMSPMKIEKDFGPRLDDQLDQIG